MIYIGMRGGKIGLHPDTGGDTKFGLRQDTGKGTQNLAKTEADPHLGGDNFVCQNDIKEFSFAQGQQK